MVDSRWGPSQVGVDLAAHEDYYQEESGTLEFVAQRRYAYMGVPYFHIDVFKRVFAQFREACQKAGYEASPLSDGSLKQYTVFEIPISTLNTRALTQAALIASSM